MAPIIPQRDRSPWAETQGKGMAAPSRSRQHRSCNLFAADQILLTGGSDLLPFEQGWRAAFKDNAT
jgi:hypothetical protein